ncbi:hypothetical protein CB0940_07742 [Cercospora beticola]|uniref:F-box domain-containing protein n=1 Tax=Cercospora beticola TaxID=122368 RepID=A0A2G5H833_CERBT|nr:hypothetical protein CB0940_07742 [Cercospora beticola]PIA88463.1 hypothetical protein CB0940_07742 [Cercospora beticola]WPB03711.1 hypothetical protein RHO25_008355 [Cercospora beticola]CAK1357528.1 unnamed protein product [Cercospora beticola]
MSFVELPTELIEMICVRCSLDEIKALRLTCHSLRNVADDYLFPEIVTVMTIDSMKAAWQIAQHPKFCKQPRLLYFQGDTSEPLKFEEWRAKLESQIEVDAHITKADRKHLQELGEISMRRGRERQIDPNLEAREKALIQLIRANADAQPKPSYSAAQLQNHFEYYSELAYEGVQIVEDGVIQRCMQEVFEKCSNIRAFDFTTANALRVHTHRENKQFRKGLITPFGDYDRCGEGLEAMGEIVLAAEKAGYSPQTLRLGSVSFHIARHLEFSKAMSRFMANVETLHWIVSTPYLEDDDLGVDSEEFAEIMLGFSEGYFIMLMESAGNLRSLEIDMPCPNPGEDKIELSDVVGSIVWANLRNFAITTVYANPSDLVDFLLRHAGTLERLELNEVTLEGEWPECFSRLAGKLPRLKEVQLRGVFSVGHGAFFCFFGDLYTSRGNEYSQSVARYIIEGGEEFSMPPGNNREEAMIPDSESDDDEEPDWDDENFLFAEEDDDLLGIDV